MTNSTTEPTQSIRERLEKAALDASFGALDAPEALFVVDTILAELQEPGATFKTVLEDALWGDSATDEMSAWREVIQHIRDGGS